MSKTENSIKEILIDLNISTSESIKFFFPRVRDREDISVLKCDKSGVILLSKTDHINIKHYSDKIKYKYFGNSDRVKALTMGKDDIERREVLLKDLVKNKNWLDFGTGSGGILDSLESIAKSSVGVEPNKIMQDQLLKAGHKIFSSIEETDDNFFDFVTMFHVFEHLVNPIDLLKQIKNKIKKNSEILIEVPHSRDFLIEFLDLESFKSFTFWSEHLILHVKESLEKFLEVAGFKVIEVYGCQRYTLSNHLYWLHHNKPGGHNEWSNLNTQILSKAYEEMLSLNDMNDTLIIRGKKIEN